MNDEISPVASILFILFVTVIILVTYLYWETRLGATKGLERYVDITQRITTLVSILVGIFLLQFYFSESNRQEKRRVSTNLQRGTIEIQKLFLDPQYMQELQPLYFEMHPSLQSSSILQSEYIVGNVIFRRIESVLDSLGDRIYQPGFQEWSRQWKMWMSSSKLVSIWKMSEDQYSSTMRDFVNNHLLSQKDT